MNTLSNSTAAPTAWIDPELYPFRPHFLDIGGHRMHYVDEGSGPVILFAHGTPEWSFGWRDLIRSLRDRYRCIAPDLLGFGLSDKPADADYSVQAHALRLQALVRQLDLQDIHLVANDFGVSIALYSALQEPERFARICLFNGWMRPLDRDPRYAWPARVMRSPLGRWLYLHRNFPVTFIMPAAFGDRKKLTPDVHRHYLQALDTAEKRIAAYTFSRELLGATDFWTAEWQQLPVLRDKPFLFFWGMKDAFIPASELAHWLRALPHAHVIRVPEAGHFVQEEVPELMIRELRQFFG